MFQKFNSLLKSFFSLNKSEQRAVFILLILLVIISAVNLSLPFFVKNKPDDFSRFKNEIEIFKKDQQLRADSLRIYQLQSNGKLNEEQAIQKLRPFPFNPNQLPLESWLQLGLSEKQITTIKNYEAKGGKFKKKEDLKKMYTISEAEYAILEPYIRIPNNRASNAVPVERKIQENKTEAIKVSYDTLEINMADSAAFVKSLHLPSWIASRVVSYRDLLGGFYNRSQLLEVYGFDTSHFQKIESYLYADTSLLVKVHINDANFKEILRHPYISYEMTKQIVNYRNQRGLFTSNHQLVDLGILSKSTYIKLAPYLTIDSKPLNSP